MKVKCEGCGKHHAVSPTAMAIIIQAFQRGDLQRMTGEGVAQLCLGGAFSPDTMQTWQMNTKTVVTFDHTQWTDKERSEETAA